MTSIDKQLQALTVGECRWLIREDIHVYCHGTQTKTGYDPRVKAYKVVTPRRDYDAQDWLTAAEAAAVLSRLSRQAG
jgi:hypothetical protein